jgi:hypothetical protein
VRLADLAVARLARAGARGVAPSEAAAGEAAMIARLAPDAGAARAWAELAADLGASARAGKAVNLDPAALVLDMFLRMETAAGIWPDEARMSTPEIVDSHTHLDFPDLAGELDAVIDRARAAGVTRMVTICTRLANEPTVRGIAEAYEGVFYAVGTHPMSVSKEPMATVEELERLARHPKCVGIGESGLDYHYTAESAEAQQGESAHPYRGGAPDGAAADHPCPRRRRRHGAQLVRGARARRLRLRHALLFLGRGAGEGRARSGLLPLGLGDRGVPEGGRAARDLRRSPRGAHPRRDRRALPRAAAASRQAQRAGLYRAYRAGDCTALGARLCRLRRPDLGNFDRLFAKAAAKGAG